MGEEARAARARAGKHVTQTKRTTQAPTNGARRATTKETTHTSQAPAPEAKRTSRTPAEKSFNGYEYHVHKRAFWTPLGVAVLVASFGVSSFCMLLPPIQSKDAAILARLLDWFIHFESREFLDYSFSNSHVSASFSLISLVIIGVVILRYANKDNEAFMEAYPFMELSFTPSEITRARHVQRRFVVAGIAVVIGALIIDISLHGSHEPKIGNGVGFCLGAVGAWLIGHGLLGDRVAQGVLYNYEALQRTSLYRIEQYYHGPEREVILAAKKRSMQTQSVNRVILVIAGLASLALYFLPTLETPFYWVPLAIGAGLFWLNVHFTIRWVIRQIRASEELQAIRDRVFHGKSTLTTETTAKNAPATSTVEAEGSAAKPMSPKEALHEEALREHRAFEATQDAFSRGVARAEEAPAKPIVASDDE